MKVFLISQRNMRHLLLKEFVLQGFLSRVGAGALEALLVLAVVLRHLPHLEKWNFEFSGSSVAHTNLVIVISPGKSLEAIREKSPTGWVKLLPVVLRQLGAKGVDGDNECPGKICLLCKRKK